MSWFFLGIAFLLLGYLIYGRIVERILGPDDRPTPAVAAPDGVDCVPLPQWKNMLIQLLNIAGVGPVIGVILGIKFGKIALLIIPLGCVLMGAVHDFLGGMMSVRMNGANLPKIIRVHLGNRYAGVFSWVMLVLLLLVVA
jgi:carbon starvation protein CstA